MKGDTVSIQWNYTDSTAISDIELWNGTSSTFTTIANSLNVTNNNYQWVVPSNLVGTWFRLKYTITDTLERTGYGMTPAYFKIVLGPGNVNKITEKEMQNYDDVGLTVYPNPPLSGILNVLLENSVGRNILSVYNVSGNLIERFTFVGKSTVINTNNFSKGNYYIQIRCANGKLKTKSFQIE